MSKLTAMNFYVKGLLIPIVFILCSLSLFAQNSEHLISSSDSLFFQSLPRLEIPESILANRNLVLPYQIDNSQLSYFRPIFSQEGFSCGQASSIGYTYTYEINRLRGLSSQAPINQYPSHFTWNFMNNGAFDKGVSLFDSWKIVRDFGCPNVVDYGGGMSLGNHIQWMDGYDKYYKAMTNQLKDFYAIDISNPEGIETLRHWLVHHMNEDETGGVANIMIASQGEESVMIPFGSPESGKDIVIGWGEWVGHQITIVGYNDSIRYDFNNDGRFTNDEDNNQDGSIDLLDWEIGAYKIANSWGENWGGQGGFKYMMYRLGAKEGFEGGLWGKSAFVINAKETAAPLLTMKVKMRHESRNKIKISAGIALNPNSTSPSYIIDFPIFNYQGGDFYMQGGNETSNQIIEFGLDLSPLLSYLEEGQNSRFFLMINENDPEGNFYGSLLNYSIIDYNSGINEIAYEGTQLNLLNNSLSSFYIDYTPNVDRLTINTEYLPPIEANTPYQYNFEASGGTPPYHWDMKPAYFINKGQSEFPEEDDQKLSLTYNKMGDYCEKELPFSFPFFGESYDKIYVHAKGLITFDNSVYLWPYTIDKINLLKNVKSIFPFYRDLYYVSDIDNGIYYSEGVDFVYFRWNASTSGFNDGTGVNFGVKLFMDGRIEMYYGDRQVAPDKHWYAGISDGNELFSNIKYISNNSSTSNNQRISYSPMPFPEDLFITEDGEISGEISSYTAPYYCEIEVYDQHKFHKSQFYKLSSDSIQIINSFNGIQNNLVLYNQTISANTKIINLSSSELTNVGLNFEVLDEDTEISSIIQEINFLGAGQTINLENTFELSFAREIENRHQTQIISTLSNNNQTTQTADFITVSAPEFCINTPLIEDNANGILDPGETSNISIPITNNGIGISDVEVELLSLFDNIIVNMPTRVSYGELNQNATVAKNFNISIPEEIHLGSLYPLKLMFYNQEDLLIDEINFYIKVGKADVLILDLDMQKRSGPQLRNTLNFKNVSNEYSEVWKGNVDGYTSVFLLLGDFASGYRLQLDEAEILTNYLDMGGNLYIEGAKTWKSTDYTPLQDYLNISSPDIDYFHYNTLSGTSGKFTSGLEIEYNIDSYYGPLGGVILHPIEPAFSIFTNYNPAVSSAVAYDAGTYKTIGSGFLLAGINESANDSTLGNVIDLYLDFFGIREIDIFKFLNKQPGFEAFSYPNPFSIQTKICFSLNQITNLQVNIYDRNGRLVNKLADQEFPEGMNFIDWEGTNEIREKVKDGLYLYQIISSYKTETGKILFTN